MKEWNLTGADHRYDFERDLTPQNLVDTIKEYQKEFGEAFGVRELLMLMDIKAKAFIAEAIMDAPEYLMDQVGQMRNCYNVTTIAGELRNLSDSLDRWLESRE